MRKVFFLCACSFFLLYHAMYGQLFIGPKGGGNYAWTYYEDDDYLSENGYEIAPVYGWSAGLTMYYRVTPLWSLQIDALYSEKGRILTSNDGSFLRDEWRMRHIDLPLVFRASFGGEDAQGFINVGPHMSYWYAGTSTYSSSELLQRDLLTEKNIDFSASEPPPEESNDKLLFAGYNHLQWGFQVGVGASIPIIDPGKLLIVELRYMRTQTQLGKNDEDLLNLHSSVFPGLAPNFESAQQMINLSVSFVFGVLYLESPKPRARQR